MKIELEIPDGKRAEWVDGVLTLVDDEPQDITKRIETFGEACIWCYVNKLGYMVDQFIDVSIKFKQDPRAKDIIAYLKLRIITCALNEGWEPSEGDGRYDAYYSGSNGNVGSEEISYLHSDSSLKLCFKSHDRAAYAASQFRDIYADFCGCEKGGEE